MILRGLYDLGLYDLGLYRGRRAEEGRGRDRGQGQGPGPRTEAGDRQNQKKLNKCSVFQNGTYHFKALNLVTLQYKTFQNGTL